MSTYPGLFPRAYLKKEAKEMLSPSWGPVLGITLIYLIFIGIDGFMYGNQVPTTVSGYTDAAGSFSYTVSGAAGMYAYGVANDNLFMMSLIALVSGVLIQGVLAYSYSAYFVRMSENKGRKMGFGVFIENFNDWLKAALAFMWQYLWTMIWGLTAIPGMAFLMVGLFGVGSDALFTALTLIGVALLCVSAVLVVMATLRYSFMYQVIADSRGKVGTRQAMKCSIAIVKTHIADVFVLGLSFIPWMIVSVLTFGLGFFYVLPYMQATYALAYQWLRDNAFEEGRLDPAVLGYVKVAPTPAAPVSASMTPAEAAATEAEAAPVAKAAATEAEAAPVTEATATEAEAAPVAEAAATEAEAQDTAVKEDER